MISDIPLPEALDYLGLIADAEFETKLMDFARESNGIEGIHKEESARNHYKRLKWFLGLKKLTIENVVKFNTAGQLRDKKGMNVRVGNHIPPRGSEYIPMALDQILAIANDGSSSAYQVHQDYEGLHPFSDGNGRSGRAVWLWMMRKHCGYDLRYGFLRCWYYASLDNERD